MKVGDLVKLSVKGRAMVPSVRSRRKPRIVGLITRIGTYGCYSILWQNGLNLLEISPHLEPIERGGENG